MGGSDSGPEKNERPSPKRETLKSGPGRRPYAEDNTGRRKRSLEVSGSVGDAVKISQGRRKNLPSTDPEDAYYGRDYHDRVHAYLPARHMEELKEARALARVMQQQPDEPFPTEHQCRALRIFVCGSLDNWAAMKEAQGRGDLREILRLLPKERTPWATVGNSMPRAVTKGQAKSLVMEAGRRLGLDVPELTPCFVRGVQERMRGQASAQWRLVQTILGPGRG
jgi:hypothetical protein